MLEVIHLSDLAADGQCFAISGSCYIIVMECIFYLCKASCQQQEAYNHQACSSFSSLAVHSNHGVFSHHRLNARQLISLQGATLVFIVNNSSDVHDLLLHLLNEEKHIYGDLKKLLN